MRVSTTSADPCGRGKWLVTVRVELGDRLETMTLTVVVPDDREESAVREFGIARAKDIARRFAELSTT